MKNSYLDRVRKYAKEISLAEAVDRAITECIREGILKEFLEKNRAEVKKMSIYEYDQEKHIRMERKDVWEEGVQEGRREGELRGRDAQLSEQIKKKLARGKSISRIAEELEETEERIQKLVDKLTE